MAFAAGQGGVPDAGEGTAWAKRPALAAGQGRSRRGHGVGALGTCASERCGGSRYGVEASRSAERTLDAPAGKYPVGQGSAVAAAESETGAGHPTRLRGAHPTAEPCLPARAGVRGLAPGCRTKARRRVPHPAAGAMPSAMSRNSARRSAWTRRAASRSVSAVAAASSSARSTPGLRWPSAPGSERNLA